VLLASNILLPNTSWHRLPHQFAITNAMAVTLHASTILSSI